MYAITQKQESASVIKRTQQSYACRRIFNNDQIIERFDKWLLICGKAKNTRASYILAAKQLGKFLVNKPLTAITKEDVRGFIGFLYTKGFRREHPAGKIGRTALPGRLFATRWASTRLCSTLPG